MDFSVLAALPGELFGCHLQYIPVKTTRDQPVLQWQFTVTSHLEICTQVLKVDLQDRATSLYLIMQGPPLLILYYSGANSKYTEISQNLLTCSEPRTLGHSQEQLPVLPG